MSYSENNSFEQILDRTLNNNLLVNLDKREGSVIYNTLAPLCLELAEAYAQLDILQEQTYLLTATGVNLDNRAYDYGIVREQATQAQRIGEFKKYEVDGNGDFVLDENENKILIDMDIPIGSRFYVPDNENIVFEYIGLIEGHKILQCESAGTGGNGHLGAIFPVNPISDLIEANIVDTYKYGQDEETDESLRKKCYDSINHVAFGGNIPDYILLLILLHKLLLII